MERYHALWEQSDRAALLSWWAMIAAVDSTGGPSSRGLRAAIRKCARIEDVFLTDAFRLLYYRLGDSFWTLDENVPGLACAAGVLSHVETNSAEGSFARQCAMHKAGSDRAVVSDLRFSQLQKSHSIDELFTRMRRTVLLLRRTVNVLSVADGVLQWYRENDLEQCETQARDRVLVRWGLEYFRSQNV